MSGFDVNPFAEPEAANPFADPAVTQYSARNAATVLTAGLEEYNPFADGDVGGDIGLGRSTTPGIVPQSHTPAATFQLPAEPLPPYQPPQVPDVQHRDIAFPGEAETTGPTDAPIAPGLGETNAADEALLTQTKSSTKVELSAAQQMELARRDPNFPPMPSFCPIKPCYYHNIQLEVPASHTRLVRFMFIYWEVQVIAYFYNMIALLALFADTGLFGSDFGFSVLWFFLFSPCSFICWYHCAYKAFLSDSSIRFMWFFVVFFCQCVFNVVQAVGFVSSGSCGLILVLQAKSSAHPGTFFMGIAAFVLWAVLALVGFLLLFKLHRYYRTSGHSIERVQTEAGSALAQNEGVRNAVVSGVKASF